VVGASQNVSDLIRHRRRGLHESTADCLSGNRRIAVRTESVVSGEVSQGYVRRSTTLRRRRCVAGPRSHPGDFLSRKQGSVANAKVSARHQCMYEGP